MTSSTPTANFTFRQVERSDVDTLEGLLFTSKLSLTINKLLFKNWPNEAVQRRNYRSALEGLDFDNSDRESLTVVDDELGKIIGHLALYRREPQTPVQDDIECGQSQAASATEQADIPDFFNADVLNAVIEAVGELSDPALKTKEHYEVVYIVVDPAYRHRGIGRGLIQHVITKAKAAQVPVAVSSEPQSYEFFTKLGFEEVKSVDMDLAQWAPPYSGFGLFKLMSMIWDP
ncbi:GNAT family N-acetyltransferase [Aspergillus mulundensis]|uniref:N-acetyltransferase domain-containing protein n=1 Tax=Aspergillus mulundensis TaxID=1810919 RepID=A0A3D8SKP4_9EURO|nr:Uncharacterized protein DSM5745_03539 [Aspergillus mulundensis]RDW86897.1 Uncharacterized protein DSM5745_03539 [Aspergillus mulundensis]